MTHLTENITYEKYVPVSHTYNSPKCVTCNTSDKIYLAREKFDRKLPCCKNKSTELFIVGLNNSLLNIMSTTQTYKNDIEDQITS